jgi:hypothetical protein
MENAMRTFPCEIGCYIIEKINFVSFDKAKITGFIEQNSETFPGPNEI